MGAVADLVIDPERPGLYTRADYYDVLRRLRSESPVHGYAPNRWALARYDDVRTVSRDPERFCSGRGVLPAADPLLPDEVTAEQFDSFAQGAKTGCPVSAALTGTTIELDAALV